MFRDCRDKDTAVEKHLQLLPERSREPDVLDALHDSDMIEHQEPTDSDNIEVTC